jgi:hypothetical protein
MRDIVSELLATAAALDELGARSISADEAAQIARNPTSWCATRVPGAPRRNDG